MKKLDLDKSATTLNERSINEVTGLFLAVNLEQEKLDKKRGVITKTRRSITRDNEIKRHISLRFRKNKTGLKAIWPSILCHNFPTLSRHSWSSNRVLNDRSFIRVL